MKSIKATEGQTIYDIAVMEYGCFEGVFFLCEDNDLSIISELIPGQLLLIRDAIPEITEANIEVANYFKTNRIIPNSGLLTARNGDYLGGDFNNIDYDVAI